MSPVHSDRIGFSSGSLKYLFIASDAHRVLDATAEERYEWDRHSSSKHSGTCLGTAQWRGTDYCSHLRMDGTRRFLRTYFILST